MNDIPVSRAAVRKVFPEARETTSSGHLEYNVHCPYPHRKGAANFKMYINAASGVFHCCDCGQTGFFWDEWTTEARKSNGRIQVGRWISKVVRDDSVLEEVESKVIRALRRMPVWKDGIHAPGRILVPLAGLDDEHPAKIYMVRERRLDPEVFGNPEGPWKACYCEEGLNLMGGRLTLSGRIIIPYSTGGVLRGWTARKIEFRRSAQKKVTWDGTKYEIVTRDENGAWPDRYIPKYFHLPSMNKSTFLYNSDQAREFSTVWAFEGPLDVWAFGPDAVCYNGEFPSSIQCRILSTWESVRWGMDPEVDLTDTNKARRHKKVLESIELEDVKWRVLSGGDPADLGREEVERQFA